MHALGTCNTYTLVLLYKLGYSHLKSKVMSFKTRLLIVTNYGAICMLFNKIISVTTNVHIHLHVINLRSENLY